MKTKIFLMVAMAMIFCLSSAEAVQKETEITTYYPAPYGEYEELKTTENASFASSSGSVSVGSTSNPTVLAVDNTLTLAPVTGDASAQAGGSEGSLRYSADAGGFLYRDSSGWKDFRGSISCITVEQVQTGIWDGNTGTTLAACPADYPTITGGGYKKEGSVGRAIGSYFDGNAYACDWQGCCTNNLGEGKMTVQARCCK